MFQFCEKCKPLPILDEQIAVSIGQLKVCFEYFSRREEDDHSTNMRLLSLVIYLIVITITFIEQVLRDERKLLRDTSNYHWKT